MNNSAQNRISFASDNNSGVHSKVMDALASINLGHEIAYGGDPYTARSENQLKVVFGEDAEVFFVFAGTGANVMGLMQITQSFQSVICAETAHIHCDECGAPEHYIGCKLLTVSTRDGKIEPEGIRNHLKGFDFEHHAQPRAISITQSTEYGTLYTLDEMKAIGDLAHEYGLLFHVDGARLANAAAALGCSLKEVSHDVGVDVLSFGGTKNGLMFGECVVFFQPELAKNFRYIRKQGMQLYSKMRFIAAQYEAYFTDDLWKTCAEQANRTARLLADEVSKIERIQITQNVQANAVFAIVPKEIIPVLQREFFFYVWDEFTSEVRWMTSFDTTEDDVHRFVEAIQAAVKE